MKKLLSKIALVFLLLLPLLGRAQETRISGWVVDSATKEPVPFASISLQQTDKGVLSNEKGYFQIQGVLKNQQDSLVCTSLRYRRTSVLIKQGLTDSLKIEMTVLPFGFTVAGPCIVNRVVVAVYQ
ncbi:carboxypeptidase-like regulatory domain-containing protein [Hymenobacter sp. IS2118]|uniref:carboxypeptidase-like regulatory domain-containing protein n=1 Tax=Hymenobacter sp. IS2118 TaxID=1505605 RepID=UPI0009072CA4|nr:carboxypeptidase-like regulatory domain-containing protein [Hymenobacter sp. IS2118]